MKINLNQYTGACECGKEHNLLTREVIIESGARKKLPDLAKSLGLGRNGAVICDTNTRPFAELCVKELDGYLLKNGIMVLDAANLHADENAVGALEQMLPEDAGWLLAAGSGTIHDATRYVAHKRNIGFLSFPTAASVDGFVSTVSAMTWYGFKKTLPGVAPLAVIADTDIFAKAPYFLTAAGIGDALGKYTSLIDWEIGKLVTGEDFCPRIAGVAREAVNKVQNSLTAIHSGSPEAVEGLMFALILSGIAMQLWGNSRPASGAEHHLSHLWEMECINAHTDALHGEKVGVGLVLALSEYRRIAAMEKIEPVSRYDGIPHSLLKEKTGKLYDDITAENTPDPLMEIDPAALILKWPEICALLLSLPDPIKIAKEMEAAGCHVSMNQIGLSDNIVPESLTLSPFVRNRLTFMRLRKLLAI